ncbi:hypothetical protein GWI33_010125 [Rhynchophorus ferrugineus]|uniref:Cytochrome P450 n=1 Tax=Rhynchophorus ferrugineus TaxID=354439 RepID=A0A834IVA3_RHYFE|nr:hypothetical protein GWI33_010125 [Rhynchophorus ferrugineus]
MKSMTLQKSIGDVIKELYNSTDEDYMGIFIIDKPVLLIRSPKLVKDILLKDFATFPDRCVVSPESKPLASNMMFFKKGPMWKAIRSKMTPVFTSGKLKAMSTLIAKEAEQLNEYIGKHCNKPNLEAKEICAKYSTNVIAICAFGVSAKCFESEDAEFRNFGRRIFEFSVANMIRHIGCFFTPNIIKLFQISFVKDEILNRLGDIFTEVLHFRKQQNQLKGNDLVDILLDVMRREDSGLNNDIIISQAIQFFVAGFETVSGVLSFALYELCINPDIQEKLRQEIQEITEKQGLTYDSIQEMKYLDMCVSETLRKYPVLPFLDRVCNSNYKLEGTDHVIEKGQSVYISMFGLHYDPKYFPEPHKFLPDRFRDKNSINQDGFYYIPFGEGPRICIGNRFGLMTVKIGLASILTKYRLCRSSKTPVPIRFQVKSLIVQSDVGIPLKFEPL